LHVAVSDEAALTGAASGVRPAHGLQIRVSDEAALTLSAPVDRPAISLLI